MNKQIFVKCQEHDFFTMWRNPKIVKEIIILIAGLGQAACDNDYFMSDLSKKLESNNVLAIHIDLYGHGDSDGDLAELSSSIVVDEIRKIVELIRLNLFYSNLPIKVVTRGVMGLCLAKIYSTLDINGLYVVSPTLFSDGLKNIIICDLLENKGQEYDKYLNSDSYFSLTEKRYLFELLGAHHSNMLGQNIPFDFLVESLSNQMNLVDGVIWVYHTNNGYQCTNDICNIKCIDSLDANEIIFPRDPMEQYKLRNLLVRLIIKQEEI